MLAIEVTDKGPGFAPEFLPHAFERFRRPDASRSRSDGGAGLGLAIVEAIAVTHGGTATAWNDPHGGACVRLELPGVGAWRLGHRARGQGDNRPGRPEENGNRDIG